MLYARFLPVTYQARQVQQHGEPCRALNQGANGGAAETKNKVSLPVSRHRRSATSAGRWLIMISDDTKFLPRRRVRVFGRPTRLPRNELAMFLVANSNGFGLGERRRATASLPTAGIGLRPASFSLLQLPP